MTRSAFSARLLSSRMGASRSASARLLAVLECVVRRPCEEGLRAVRTLDGATDPQQLGEERSRELGAKGESVVGAGGLTSGGLVLGAVHRADDVECVLGFGHTVLARLEELSTRVGLIRSAG